MMRVVTRELLVALFFVAASIAATWPLTAHLNTAVSDPGDPYYSMAIMDWNCYATLHHPGRLFHQPIFHPARYTLAFTEHLYGITLPVLPLYLLGVPIIALYNIALLLGFALCGYGTYVLARTMTGCVPAAMVAGLFFAFVPYRITQTPHISYVWAGWIPLLLAALLAYDRRPSWRTAALFGAAYFMNGLTCMHWMAMATVAIFATVFFLWIIRQHDRRYLARLALATGVAILLLLPFLLPYKAARELYSMRRSADEAQYYSAQLRDWLVAEPYLPYGRLLNDGTVDAERWLFPGITALVLAAAALFFYRQTPNQARAGARLSTRLVRVLDVLIVITAIWSILEIGSKDTAAVQLAPRILVRIGANPLIPSLCLLLLLSRLSIRLPGKPDRSLLRSIRESRYPDGMWISLLWVLMGVIGSLGLNSFFYAFLFDYVRAFRSIRVPARWSMVAYVGIAMLISYGVIALAQKTRRRIILVSAIAGAILFLETSPAPRRWYLSNSPIPPVYQWLAKLPADTVVLEIPIASGGSDYAYMRFLPLHRRITLNGVSSFIPADFDRLLNMTLKDPIEDELLNKIEQVGCTVIVIHSDGLGPHDRSTREWLARNIRNGRLAFIRRFPHLHRGDYVFAVTRVSPQAAFWREPEIPDRAGATPSAHLRTFLQSNEPTFFDTTITALEPFTPSWDAMGPLTISGWAVSPRGIREVNLRFQNGAVVIPAEHYGRSDISYHAFPWYPETTLAGFRKKFDRKPDWAREDEEMQVEVIDGAGQRFLLDPVFFSWRDRDEYRRRDWTAEPMRALLYRLYRRRDSAELRRAVKTGLSSSEIAYALTRQTRKKNDRDFIARCYQILLNREPDEKGIALHLASLQKGRSRRDVVKTFLRSDEFLRVNLGR